MGRLGSLIACLLVSAIPAWSETMKMHRECMGNAIESCVLVMDGPIDTDAPSRLAAILSNATPHYVLLNSQGGNVDAALRMGRMLREAAIWTEVGRAEIKWDAIERKVDDIHPDSDCLSACAYLFLGGIVRSVYGDGRLGFHQVSLPGDQDLPGEAGLRSGQIVSALLVSYIIEMGVDARLLAKANQAAGADMYFPSDEDLVAFDLTTQNEFGPFYLKPYKNGIIAASDFGNVTYAFSRVKQITAFCEDDSPYFLLLTQGASALHASLEQAEPTVGIDGETFPASSLEIWSNTDSDFLKIGFSEDLLVTILPQNQLIVDVWFPRAVGGNHRAAIDLSDEDSKMLAAAFRFCI